MNEMLSTSHAYRDGKIISEEVASAIPEDGRSATESWDHEGQYVKRVDADPSIFDLQLCIWEREEDVKEGPPFVVEFYTGDGYWTVACFSLTDALEAFAKFQPLFVACCMAESARERSRSQP